VTIINRATIAFIYHGSSGVAGGYTDKFVEGLSRYATVHAFVNCDYAYPIDRQGIKIHRIFFPVTDNLLTRKSLLRSAVRFFELMGAYIIVAFYLAIIRAKYIVYNPITNLAITEKFVALGKLLCGRLVVVVHDARSHYDVAERHRDAIFMNADVLVVHNEHSRITLQQRLAAPGATLLVPFPWSMRKLTVHRPTVTANILFIGHVRPSKGMDFLLEAYPKYLSSGGALGLAVAGSMPSSIYKRVHGVASRVINATLNDQEFLEQIASSKFLVMPYRPGYFNSSVHLCAVIHCETPFICSDIELFSSFADGIDCLKFKYGDVESFASVLRVAETLSDSSRMQMAACALRKMEANMGSFDELIGGLFEHDVATDASSAGK
jgi:glycosyltransferase involved in cell wall biosynthesis